MDFQIEKDVEYDFYPYEHPFDNAWRIELGGGQFFYIYKDHEPFLMIQAPTFYPPEFTDAVIFHDRLVIGSCFCGIFIVDLRGDKQCIGDFRIQNIEIDGYFGYFALGRDVLYVLGMHHIYAFNSDLHLLWKTAAISTDGVTFESMTDDTMVVSCNYDPMEEWFTTEISLKDGKVVK